MIPLYQHETIEEIYKDKDLLKEKFSTVVYICKSLKDIDIRI